MITANEAQLIVAEKISNHILDSDKELIRELIERAAHSGKWYVEIPSYLFFTYDTGLTDYLENYGFKLLTEYNEADGLTVTAHW